MFRVIVSNRWELFRAFWEIWSGNSWRLGWGGGRRNSDSTCSSKNRRQQLQRSTRIERESGWWDRGGGKPRSSFWTGQTSQRFDATLAGDYEPKTNAGTRRSKIAFPLTESSHAALHAVYLGGDQCCLVRSVYSAQRLSLCRRWHARHTTSRDGFGLLIRPRNVFRARAAYRFFLVGRKEEKARLTVGCRRRFLKKKY